MINFWMDEDHIQLYISPLQVSAYAYQGVVYINLALPSMNSPYLKKKYIKGSVNTYELMAFSDINISSNMLERGFTI